MRHKGERIVDLEREIQELKKVVSELEIDVLSLRSAQKWNYANINALCGEVRSIVDGKNETDANDIEKIGE